MMEITFDDTAVKSTLWPFTATKNAADIRVGILTIREKWERLLMPYDNKNFDAVTVNASQVPCKESLATIDEKIFFELYGNDDSFKTLQYPWDIFLLNDWAVRKDYEWITHNRQSQTLSASNTLIAPENIFVEEGASVECAIINAAAGPVYIGKNATVMEGCLIKGPVALCEGAVLKMGAKVYGATTIGPHCIAGGEIKNTVMQAYSNKAHDGYLGDSVIGEWCNLGAGTSNSNVKNTAGTVKMWNNTAKEYVGVGIKAGLIMGDYSRAAINTSFNTGTVVGICCNIFGSGFPPKFINSFTWGNERYIFENAIKDIGNWKKLKKRDITEEETAILKQLYNQSN
jgi:UDP-N-acetylglucosamine diphosphorylase / glucose-1-phosphate thymidylyltransferase / UDP-N-acetylgalactosamine diphosphorylase / glucosamine-1-phosphate N-acetyltransferase / galactosamine-1-phosphate N-acetyltransferase